MYLTRRNYESNSTKTVNQLLVTVTNDGFIKKWYCKSNEPHDRNTLRRLYCDLTHEDVEVMSQHCPAL